MRPYILGNQVCEIQSCNSLKFCDKSGVQNNSRVLEENTLLVLWKRQTLSGEGVSETVSDVLCSHVCHLSVLLHD